VVTGNPFFELVVYTPVFPPFVLTQAHPPQIMMNIKSLMLLVFAPMAILLLPSQGYTTTLTVPPTTYATSVSCVIWTLVVLIACDIT
jgi:hypothetical protein